MCGLGSSVGIATDYGLDGPGSNPGGDEIFRPSRPDLGPPSFLENGYRVFPGVEAAEAWSWSPPHLVCRGPRKSRAIHLLTQRTFVACKKVKPVRVNLSLGSLARSNMCHVPLMSWCKQMLFVLGWNLIRVQKVNIPELAAGSLLQHEVTTIWLRTREAEIRAPDKAETWPIARWDGNVEDVAVVNQINCFTKLGL